MRWPVAWINQFLQSLGDRRWRDCRPTVWHSQAGHRPERCGGGPLKTRKRKVIKEISVETTESIFIRRSGHSAPDWCSHCGMSTEMLSLEDAALATGLSARFVQQWIDAGRVHFTEPREGAFRVCLRSLSRQAADP